MPYVSFQKVPGSLFARSGGATVVLLIIARTANIFPVLLFLLGVLGFPLVLSCLGFSPLDGVSPLQAFYLDVGLATSLEAFFTSS